MGKKINILLTRLIFRHKLLTKRLRCARREPGGCSWGRGWQAVKVRGPQAYEVG